MAGERQGRGMGTACMCELAFTALSNELQRNKYRTPKIPFKKEKKRAFQKASWKIPSSVLTYKAVSTDAQNLPPSVPVQYGCKWILLHAARPWDEAHILFHFSFGDLNIPI
jgi:hypothetical protein